MTTKVNNRMIDGSFVNVKDFGAVGDGITDDTVAIQSALDSTTRGQTVYFPEGQYYVTASLDTPTYEGSFFNNNGVTFQGCQRNTAAIVTDQDINVILLKDFCKFRDLTLEQKVEGTGNGFFSAGQVRFVVLENVNVIRFKFGFISRYTLWISFRDCYFVNNLCGIRLSRNDDQENQTDLPATDFWNRIGGWFNNQITFDNILCNGGEIGIWASCMGASLNNITCQGQDGTDIANNKVLPINHRHTGMWLDGGGTGSTNSYNNVITNYYTEETHVSLKVFNTRHVTVNGWFAQGKSAGVTNDAVLWIENSDISIDGQDGSSLWDNAITAVDSTISSTGSIVASTGALNLTNTVYTTNGIYTEDGDIGTASRPYGAAHLEDGLFLNGSSQALSNYSEGFFTGIITPETSGSITLSSSDDLCSYTRVGRVVQINARVDVASVSSPTGSYVDFGTLPYRVAQLAERSGSAGGAQVTAFIGGSATPVALPCIFLEGATSIRWYVDPSQIQAGSSFYFSFSYITDA